MNRKEPEREEIHHLLHRLGVTEDYIGFYYFTYAMEICIKQPERLLFITKEVYAEVAEQYMTNWKAVERNLRTVGSLIWRKNMPLMERLAGKPLSHKLTTKELLTMLYYNMYFTGSWLNDAEKDNTVP